MFKFLPVITIVTLLLCEFRAVAQTYEVKGSVVDSTGVPLAGVNIKITSPSDTLITASNAYGGFQFAQVKSPQFNLTAALIGFKTYSQAYTVSNNNGKTFKLDPIKLSIQFNQLSEVTVIGINPIVVKEDTIQYNASAYPVQEGAPVEDVLKKLPGVTVDKDGNVTAQGKQISRVRVNGKDFFGGDVQTATQNLPADIIENLQIIDDYGDEANRTGVKTEEPEKILNITIQPNKRKGYFGRGTVGGGSNDRYVGRIMGNSFKEDRQLSVLGSINNTNSNVFNFNGGGRGGGARGANYGSDERSKNSDGLTRTQSIGLNYRDQWGKKLSVYGSYSLSGANNSVTGRSFTTDFNPNNISTTSRNSDSRTTKNNQRLTWNMEYTPDTANFVKITPYFSYASSDGGTHGISEIQKQNYYTLSNTSNNTHSSTPSAGTDFLFNHRFSKPGRNISLSGSIDYSGRNRSSNPDNSYLNIDSTGAIPVSDTTYRYQHIGTDNSNIRFSAKISYLEPIGKQTRLEIGYKWTNSSSKSLRDVNDIDRITGNENWNTDQSNNYHYQFTTHNFTLNYIFDNKKTYNYTIGVVAQPTRLYGEDIGRNFSTVSTNFHFRPRARFVYKFSRSNYFTATYGSSSNEPSFSQLQPIVDSSNVKNIIIGNPNLKAEFTNRLSLQYNRFDIASGNSFFSNLSFNQINNRIVNDRINNQNGTGDTTTYRNTNGFYSLNGNVAYTKPFSERKYTVTVSASGSYDNNISFTDHLKNHGQNWNIRPGARFRLDLENIIDADFSVSYNINNTITKYSAPGIQKTSTRTLNMGIDGKNYFFDDAWTLGYSFSKELNYGYLYTNNANPTLLSGFIEYRFLKKHMASLRLQAFDLLNENTGISRTVNGTRVIDSQNNRLGRYFLLTFNLRLQKFAGRSGFQRRNESGNKERTRDIDSPGSGSGRSNGGSRGFGGGRRGGF
ncbi:outer membrane beta-barrel protein (plasmid) [Pedobacter sp. BS3]|uniref:outer membrane beta-barrel protein n=1 Tax=Pedobacter sp. BS3 TaxID=2567937 RepID=UPI0011F045D9|nr:outer membrane beta-barrel protein [Pedobacter sp. BS3]TZF85739.1 outer membrane beta-barrel protein [Pedobacter sp. BS3]